MKRDYIFLGLIFLMMAFILHFIHFLIFHDVYYLFFYLLLDIAFLPLEVFFVVLVVERMLATREQKVMMQKLNMVIGAFFSEVGNELLSCFLDGFKGRDDLCNNLTVSQQWDHQNFKNALKYTTTCAFEPDSLKLDLAKLRKLLVAKREFLLRLLENPNLLEHERFTDLLWATFHLTEELEARPSLENIPSADLVHIFNDIQRAYGYLLKEWLYYVEHLKKNYPFLYSLIVRTQPFRENPSPVIVG
jgi:hypothetical protein